MSVRRSLAWTYTGQFLSFAVQFSSSIVVARLLSPHEIGIFALAMALQGIIGIFVNFGVGPYVVREAELQPGTLDGAFTVNAIMTLALAALLVAASFGGSWLLGDPAAANVLRLSAVAAVIGIFTFNPSVMMQREMRFKELSIIGLTSGMVTSATTIAAALLGASYMSPAYGFLVAGVYSVTAYWITGRQHRRVRLSFTQWRRLTTFGLQMMSVSGVSQLAMRLSDVVLGRLLGTVALGLYSRASSLSNMIFEQVYGTATRVVFVQLSKEYRETGELRVTFLRGFQMITAVMWPILIGLAILSRPFIQTLYGPKWLAAATPLSLLMIAQFFTLCFGMNWELFVLREETARQTKYETTRSAIGLATFSIGSLFSVAGAAIGRIVDAFIGFLFYYPHVRRLAKLSPGEMPAIYRQGLLLTAMATAPSAALMIVHGGSPTTPLVQIAAAVLVGGLAWIATAARLDHPVWQELAVLTRHVHPALGERLGLRGR